MPAVPPAEILQRRGVDTVFNHFGRDGKYYGDGTDPAGIDVVIMTRVKEYDESLDGSEMEFSRLGFQFSLRSYKMVEKSIELKHGDKLELLSHFTGTRFSTLTASPNISVPMVINGFAASHQAATKSLTPTTYNPTLINPDSSGHE